MRRARVIDVRVGHRRVLAHDVHAADLAVVGGVHDLDHREAGLRIERRAPELLEALRCASGVVHALVVRDTSSGSGPSRTRPARCSGRAADAARCPGRPTWPVIRHSAIRQRALSVPWTCCEMPMPHRIIEPFEVAKSARHLADRLAPGCRRSAPSSPGGSPSRSPSAPRSRWCGRLTKASFDQALVDDRVDHRVQQRDVGVGLELQEVRRVAREVGAARVGVRSASRRASPRSSSRSPRPDGSRSGWRR